MSCNFLKLMDISVPLTFSISELPAALPCLPVNATVLVSVTSLGRDALTLLGCGSGSMAGDTVGCSRRRVTLQHGLSTATAQKHPPSTPQMSLVKCQCLNQYPHVQGFREENLLLPAWCPLEAEPGECSSMCGTGMGSVGNVPFGFQG